MDECAKCGISGEKARLFDVISKEGIIKVCSHCLSGTGLPLIKRPTSTQINDSEKSQSYRESVKQFNKIPGTSNYPRSKEDVNLREIVDRNLNIPSKEEMKPRPDLVDNFHWVIMRERRAKHISREQFARDIGESETLVKMVEQGVLPENDNRVINKIESYLNISLRRPGFKEEVPKSNLGFDSAKISNLTISDLKEMKNQQEEDILLDSVDVWDGDIEEEKAPEKEPIFEQEEDKELSQEDIDDLIFGR